VLLREDDRGVLAIGQASHAWISGQLARAWGNARFGAVDPREEVCLGAEQHDIGMAAWDLSPARNPDTGLPRSFMEMPIDAHLELWSSGPRKLVRQSRYAALLASIHGSRLYQHRDLDKLPAAEADAVRGFLSEQRRFQDELLLSLRADPVTAREAAEEVVARNSRLVWIWDTLSLAICLRWAPYTATEVPAAREPVEIHLTGGDRPEKLTLDPWPFASGVVIARCEGQRLTARYDSDGALRDALAIAPWETLDFELSPAAPSY
jgi:Protein of unknown function (DUF3891)